MKSLVFAFLIVLTLPVFAKEIITLGNADKVAQTPTDCLKAKEVCAFKTSREEKFIFRLGESQIVLDQNTALVRLSDNHVVLVSGQIWVKAGGEVNIQTEYGSAKAFNGNFLVRNIEKRMDIKAIDTDLIVNPKMSVSELKLEAGEQNWLGPVDAKRVASSGVPLPIRPSELVVNWSRLYTGTKVQFESDFKNFFVLWSSASEKLAKLHAEITLRQIASIKDEIARKKQMKEDRDRENRRIKEWFRKRALSD